MNQQSEFVQNIARHQTDDIRQMFYGMPAEQVLDRVGTTRGRNVNYPDSWSTEDRIRVFFLLSFRPNTRYVPGGRHLNGTDDGIIAERSLEVIVEFMTDVMMTVFGDRVESREVARALILSTVAFGNRMPLGKYQLCC